MRVSTFFCFITGLLLICPAIGRTQASSVSTALQDSQAVTVLNQVLTAAGGAQALKAVADYSGTGDITLLRNAITQGTVTVQGLGSVAFRLDANLPTGVRSWAVHDGHTMVKNENGQVRDLAPTNPNVPSSDAYPYQTPLFPSGIAFPTRQLTNVIGNPQFRITYKGITQADSHTAHDIQVEWVSPANIDPMRKYHSRDFFVDTMTFQIVMTEDFLPKNVPHQIHYSNYSSVSAVGVPLTLTEYLGGQPTWTIQLHQMAFNTGLQDSAFVLQ